MDLATVKSLVPAPAKRYLARVVKGDGHLRPRHYIPSGKSVECFFLEVRQAAAKCVVLRWFESLPAVEPGEDIDMLVADEDLPTVLALLDRSHGTIPCDVYSAGGLAGTQYKGLAYFPPLLAARTIKRREVRDHKYQVPSAVDHFHGLAYHAVYQKGLASGLPSRLSGIVRSSEPEHDYAGVLSRLRDAIGANVAIDLESLDIHLADQGYRPTSDTLLRLSKSNEWIVRRFFP